ncbi:MAG: crossover junction endodeoxyribonuclease RuvC [Opitutales bacterium]|jgi:crossover junction endodeoxyribonuclease RuvC
MARKSARAQWAAQIENGTLGNSQTVPTPALAGRKAFNGIILGVDPSLRGTGLAVLKFDGGDVGQLIHSETVSPPKTAQLPECLGCIAEAVERLIRLYTPDAVAIEETIYVQNFRTAQKLGAARGAAIGQAALRGIPVAEYPPLRIKQAVVGFGRASKEQVARQMKALLRLQVELPFDEADAAATALCHAWTG